MGTQVAVRYEFTAVGRTPASLLALIAGVLIPPEIFTSLGLRVITDISDIAGNQVRRTLTLGFTPSAAPGATLVLNAANQVQAVTITAPGLDLIKPPILRASAFEALPGGKGQPLFRTFLDVQQVALDAGGTLFSANPTGTFLGGLPPPPFRPPYGTANNPAACVRRIDVEDPGFGYPAGTVVSLIGSGTTIAAQATAVLDGFGRVLRIDVTDMGAGYLGVPQVMLTPPAGFTYPSTFQPAKANAVMASGRPARGTVTQDGAGHVTGMLVTDPGSGYVDVPTILIQDPTGSGAILRAQMGVERADVIAPGVGVTSSVANFTAYFIDIFGTSNIEQAKPFFRLLEQTFARGVTTPVFSDAPVVT